MFRTVWNIGVELARMVTGPVAAIAAGLFATGAVSGIGFAAYALAFPFEAPRGGESTLVYLAIPYASAMLGIASAWGGRGALFLLAWAAR